MPTVAEIIDFLEDKGSLELGASPWDPDSNWETEEIYGVDWRRLFGRRPNRDGQEWDLYGDEWEFPIQDERIQPIIEAIATDRQLPSEAHEDLWDVCAWYQPIHFHGHDWGIYIRENCMLELARKIALLVKRPAISTHYNHHNIAKAVVRASFCLLYLHELYHHKSECLGIRLHVVEGKSSYIPYFQLVYKPASGTDDQLEESIANAFMYRNIGNPNYLKWLSRPIVDAAQRYLDISFPSNPPSYRKAPLYLTSKDFAAGENKLKSQIHEATLRPSRNINEWDYAPRINQSFFNIRSNIWSVVPKGARSIIPANTTPLTTCSSNVMISICKKFGYQVVPGGKGSHIKMKKANSPTITIPGNRTNLSPGAAKNILDCLGGYRLPDIHSLA